VLFGIWTVFPLGRKPAGRTPKNRLISPNFTEFRLISPNFTVYLYFKQAAAKNPAGRKRPTGFGEPAGHSRRRGNTDGSMEIVKKNYFFYCVRQLSVLSVCSLWCTVTDFIQTH